MVKMIFYYLAWICLIAGWIVDPKLWSIGVIAGWFFHMVVCSIVLHKYFSHRTFQVNWFIHRVFCILGSLNLNGSIIAWANLHRLHHARSDKEGDPHDPRKIGFIRSLFVFGGYEDKNLIGNLKCCKDLSADPYLTTLHRHCDLFLIAFYLMLLAISWKLVFVLLIATAISFIGLFFTTYVYHFRIPFLHYRSKDTSDNSQNNWLTTILFPGEAYHNNHHADSSRYDCAERWWEFDISALIIKLIARRSK